MRLRALVFVEIVNVAERSESEHAAHPSQRPVRASTTLYGPSVFRPRLSDVDPCRLTKWIEPTLPRPGQRRQRSRDPDDVHEPCRTGARQKDVDLEMPISHPRWV